MKWIILLLIIMIIPTSVNASIVTSTFIDFNGNGLAEYPNEGYIVATGLVSQVSGYGGGETASIESVYYDTKGNSINYKYTSNVYFSLHCNNINAYAMHKTWGGSHTSYCSIGDAGSGTYEKDSCMYSVTTSSKKNTKVEATMYTSDCSARRCKANSRITITTNNVYNVSGNVSCLDSVELMYNSTVIDVEYFDETDNDYKFENLIAGTYNLNFSDSTTYEFTIIDSDIVYDYDACTHTKYRFKESCGHLIPDSEGYYCMDWVGGGGICRNFYAPSGILDISNESCAAIKIYTNTFIGQKWWYFSPVLDNETYNCINTAIDWGLKVIVQNGSDGTLIDDAMVRVNQTCYCTHEGCVINPDQSCTCGGTSVRQKKTVSGMVSFGEMSLQDASLFVMASDYKILDESSTGYSAFLSGRANFSSKTWIVKLAPNGDANESDWFELQNKVDIHFRNVGGNRTSKILDTDANVYLYYENNNSENEAMTLKFQSSSTHTYFSDEQSWTIAYDDIGHKTIANSYFTPWNYAYRAVIYNSSIYGWNLTIPLTVRNGTKEEDQHYGNLTTNLWFMHETDGKIDYREDMEIVSHAGSNNTTLMNIDLEIWKDGVLLCYKNLTATDYTGASFPYYYVYEPVYEYVSGSNYTAKMYGFDRTLLEVRYLECVTDNTTRKNRLTIGVKNRSGTNLDNCYIYLEDWGSLPTGSNYYNSYEGIDNGYYRYKASKSGYSGTGWADVTLSDDDEIVWYTLTEDHTNASATQQKLTDDDIKGIFFPLMFFLLICIVFGGFKYVSS